jgi:hypothetical protein
MSLFDELQDENNFKSQNGSKCTVCNLLETLAPDEAKLLSNRLDNPEIPKAAVARVLMKNGYKIRPNTLTRHARRECNRA